MSKILFIVESPNKCKKLNTYLGSNYIVMASVGHVQSIPRKGMNIDIKNGFIPHYEISSDKKEVVKKIRNAAKTVDSIILATDADREGEAIAHSVYDLFNATCKKKCVRITFNEITKKAVLDAVASPRDIDMDQVNAQKARQVLDRLIGYKISPLLWFTVGSGLSAGRVQSIALKIVAQREKEILAFKPTDYWLIDALLQSDDGDFWARVVTKEKDNRYLDDKLSAKDFEELKKATFKVDKIEKKEVKRKALPPFDTVALQKTCSSVFGWSTKKTSMIAQALYEKGKITYIRTDSYNISKEAVDSVRTFIKESTSSKYLPAKPNIYVKKSKLKAGAQEAHECIRPTDNKDSGSDLDDSDHKKMYQLIRSRFVACQMTPMLVNTVTYTVASSTKKKLIAKGQTIKFDGWSKVYKYSMTKEEVLPVCVEGEKLDLKDSKRTKHSTQPPPRYKEGSLVEKMEKEGVGRPSTYASIMDSIQKRGYVEKTKGKNGSLQATELGLRVFEFLNKNFSDFIMNLAFTANMEEDLDKIEHGEKTYVDVVDAVYKVMQAEIKKAEKDSPKKKDVTTGEKCKSCENGYIVQRHGKFGDFYSCDQYPKCKSVYVKDDDGKFNVKKRAVAKTTGKKCPECEKNGRKGEMVERKNKKDGSMFYGCSLYPKCRCSKSELD